MVERSDSFIYQAFFADSGDQEGYDAVNRFGVKLPRSGFVVRPRWRLISMV
jgi:hypothetical protein